MKTSAKQYAQALWQMTEGKTRNEAKKEVEKLARFLVQKNEIGRLEQIIEHFSRLWDQKRGIVRAEVLSARALDKKILGKISKYVEQAATAKEVIVSTQVDEKLLGGAVIKYQDKIWDGSLKTRLAQLKTKLSR